MKVEVCYPTEAEQKVHTIHVPQGTTVIGAILAAGILESYPKIALANNVGIFSQKVTLDTLLGEGDRVEIYRPLKLSPNELRLLRARKKL